jgi:2,5-diketo-D-gluconate reductase A
MTVPTIQLNDGTSIPQLGVGVFQVEPDHTAQVVRDALDLGYRHIDTAQMYGNEAEVGQAIRESGVDRAELFVTTKLNNNVHEPDRARAALDESLAKLGPIDLLLIHWPLPTRYGGDYPATWQALVDVQKAGDVRSIGVSNFQPAHLERIIAETGVVPVINQVEVHPYFGNEAVRAANAEHRIATEAWSPIAQGDVLGDDVITAIAEETGRTPAQVTLRWHVQRGDIIFPKSNNRDRLEQNFAIFDFELDEQQMTRITALDRGPEGRRGPNPDTFDYIPD